MMNTLLSAVLLVAGIGLAAGLILSIASIVMAVKGDEKAEKIRDELPGANCGACGFSGCDGYAEALAKGAAEPGLCAPGAAEVNRKIGEILGTEVSIGETMSATVFCKGSCDNVENKMHYSGISSCKAAATLYSGPSACNFGCIGFGDCKSACKFGAIDIKNGKARVDSDKCTTCKACISTCPKGIISLVPKERTAAKVNCSNRDKGVVARKVCSVACIGCGKCVKTCEFGAVTLENNLARIDFDKCTACGKCAEACPMHCISLQGAKI